MKPKGIFKIMELAVCRSPLFPPHAKLEDKLEDLKLAIREGSADFYEIIKPVSADGIKDLDLKIRFTLWKYFNRAKYRATPFGQFSSISVVPFLSGYPDEYIRIKKQQQFHRLIDWGEKDRLDPGHSLYNGIKIKSNNTFYLCGEEIRYIAKQNGNFELTAIDNIPLVNELLEYCSNTQELATIYEFVGQRTTFSESQTVKLLQDLIDLELLYTEQFPNITGPDYFERLQITDNIKDNPYTISERPLISGGLKEMQIRELKEALGFLTLILPKSNQTELITFKQAFLRKFEHHEVSFLTALDPETGISYANLEHGIADERLVGHLKNLPEDKNTLNQQTLNYGLLHQFLLNKLTQYNPKTNIPIQLEELNWTDNISSNKFANTVSAVIQFTEDQIIVQNIGGITANALLGRFTVASPVIEEHGRQIAQLEADANPDIIFFDIAYQSEKQVDNINRRKHLYSHELALLTWSCHENQIDPSDLLISVKNDEIIIKSIKYNKRVIPRIATAYNYLRSDLSIYRFLCDLQHQGLQTNLSLNMQQYFPGLDHYPRIQYKKVIISPASWLVPAHFNEKTVAIEKRRDDLAQWLKSVLPGKYFKAGSSDQTLCFDTENPEELLFFLLFNQKQKSSYIYEAFIPGSSFVRDEYDEQYLAEFIVNFQHTEKIYDGLNGQSGNSYNKPKMDLKLPGSEWLYFEIYCHPNSADQILSSVIEPLIFQLKKQLSKWFFIRYTDPAYHIRLRFKLKSPADGFGVIAWLSNVLEPFIQSGRITDLQIKPYSREVFRYGIDTMDHTESIFHLDSIYVLSLLKRNLSVNDLYGYAIHLLLEILNGLNMDIKVAASFVKEMADNFSHEHQLSTEGFKKINENFKTGILNKQPVKRSKKIENHYLLFRDTVIGHLKEFDTELQIKLLADLFHMHINRIFNQDQRMHELLIYQYLVKVIRIKQLS